LSRRKRPFGRKERETRLAAERLIYGEVVVEEARVLDQHVDRLGGEGKVRNVRKTGKDGGKKRRKWREE
jgi:hypothetical protein